MRQKGIRVSTEQVSEVIFRQQQIGRYIADLIAEDSVIIELKCCSFLLPEHQAQLMNYLTVSDISIGLLVNFGNSKLEYKRLCHPKVCVDKDDFDTANTIPSFHETTRC